MIYAIEGTNGAGKSTYIKNFVGLHGISIIKEPTYLKDWTDAFRDGDVKKILNLHYSYFKLAETISSHNQTVIFDRFFLSTYVYNTNKDTEIIFFRELEKYQDMMMGVKNILIIENPRVARARLVKKNRILAPELTEISRQSRKYTDLSKKGFFSIELSELKEVVESPMDALQSF